MSLSFEKLYSFIDEHHFSMGRIFSKDKQPFLLEIISPAMDTFIVLLDANYPFSVPANKSMLPMTEQSMDHTQEDIDDYIHVTEPFLQSTYSVSHVRAQIGDEYKQHSVRDTIVNQQLVKKKSLFRQLQRLKYSITGMQVGMVLIDPPFIGVLDTDYTITMYICEQLRKTEKHQTMCIVFYFRMFFDTIQYIDHTCSELLTGIHQVLYINQSKHLQKLQTLLSDERLSNVKKQVDEVLSVRQYVQQYTTLLQRADEHIKEKSIQLQSFSDTYSSLHGEMKRNHQYAKISKELESIHETRQELKTQLHQLKSQQNHLLLRIDTILFDTMIMFQKILDGLCK